MEAEVVVTYETLFEILRQEKYRPEIQKLDKDFFENVVKYLHDKRSILASQEGKSSIFSSSEAEKTKKQIENLQKILSELYERRESKILQMALFSARSEDKGKHEEMLPEEEKLFKELRSLLIKYKKDILLKMLALEVPQLEKEEPKELKSEKKRENKKLLRLLESVPSFVAEDLKVYGPFEKDTEAEIPEKAALLLIKNKRAEEVKNEG